LLKRFGKPQIVHKNFQSSRKKAQKTQKDFLILLFAIFVPFCG